MAVVSSELAAGAFPVTFRDPGATAYGIHSVEFGWWNFPEGKFGDVPFDAAKHSLGTATLAAPGIKNPPRIAIVPAAAAKSAGPFSVFAFKAAGAELEVVDASDYGMKDVPLVPPAFPSPPKTVVLELR
jgi:hypothetical protein